MTIKNFEIKRKITVKNGDHYESIELGFDVEVAEESNAESALISADTDICDYIAASMGDLVIFTIDEDGVNHLTAATPVASQTPVVAPKQPATAPEVSVAPTAPAANHGEPQASQPDMAAFGVKQPQLPKKLRDLMAVTGTITMEIMGQEWEMIDQRPLKNCNVAHLGQKGISDNAPDFVSMLGSASDQVDKYGNPYFKHTRFLYLTKDGVPVPENVAIAEAAGVQFKDVNNPRSIV